MASQLIVVLLKNLRTYVQTEVNTKEELHFEAIHFTDENTPNFGVVCVVVVGIVKEFRCEEYGSDGHSVHVKVSQQEVIPLDESINIDQSQYEALVRARRIFMNTTKRKKERCLGATVRKKLSEIKQKDAIKRSSSGS